MGGCGDFTGGIWVTTEVRYISGFIWELGKLMRLFFGKIFAVFLAIFIASNSYGAFSCQDLFTVNILPEVSLLVRRAVHESGVQGQGVHVNNHNENLYAGTYLVVKGDLPTAGVPSFNLTSLQVSRINEISNHYGVNIVLGEVFTHLDIAKNGNLLYEKDMAAMLYWDPIPEFGLTDRALTLLLTDHTDMPILEHEIQHIEDTVLYLKGKLQLNYAARPELEQIYVLLTETRALTVEYEAHSHYPARFSTIDGIYKYFDQILEKTRPILKKMKPETRKKIIQRMVEQLTDIPQNEFLDHAIRVLHDLEK